MSKMLITKLILYYSSIYGMDGNTMLSVAKVESGLNPNAIGQAGELGIYQILPQYSKLTKQDLKDPVLNIREGIRLLKVAKETCIHKKANDYLVCYNFGSHAAKSIKHPRQFRYVKKVNEMLLSVK